MNVFQRAQLLGTMASLMRLAPNVVPAVAAARRRQDQQKSAADFAAIRAAEAKRARRAAKRAPPELQTPVMSFAFSGMDIIVLPDDADEMAHIPEDSIGSIDGKFFVRASLWPLLKVAIESQQPDFGEPE